MLRNLKIGLRLTIGFGVLVLLTFLVGGLNYVRGVTATGEIERTAHQRVPTVLSAVRAQQTLLRLTSDVRGYLAVETDDGKQAFRTTYQANAEQFSAALAELQGQAPYLQPEINARVQELQQLFDNRWRGLPERLFKLHDDELARAPAYQRIATVGEQAADDAVAQINILLDSQLGRAPTPEGQRLIDDMISYQETLLELKAGVRSYVMTRNQDFKQEYETNRAANDAIWENLEAARPGLTASQQQTLEEMARTRRTFLALLDPIIATAESEHWREDLLLFRNELLPLSEQMDQLLDAVTTDQQQRLHGELEAGRAGLVTASQQGIVLAIAAVVLGTVLAVTFRHTIVGPVRRLTTVADRIRSGDLGQEARVDGRDELGILARAFNSMTSQLRQTLAQVRHEKKQASDLLDVVIPIGVELSAERDFGRLLERMVVEAIAFCRADVGILYLLTPDDHLQYAIVRAKTAGITLGGTTNVAPPYPPLPIHTSDGVPNEEPLAVRTTLKATTFNYGTSKPLPTETALGPALAEAMPGYRVSSVLTLPLKTNQGRVEGVLQLVNAQDAETGQVITFDDNLRQMMESFSSPVAASLEAYLRERSLRQEIQQLRVEIDEARRQKQVSEIVESDFFRELQERARTLRRPQTPENP